MTITPNSNVFTALSLTDIAKPVPRAAAQPIERPDAENGQRPVTRTAEPETGARFRQAVDGPKAEGQEDDAAAPRQQAGEDFRREAVNPRRPTFQKLGQMVDLSV